MTKWLAALMASTALLPAAASAQNAAGSGTAIQAAAEEDARSGDIIVTAQRYQQRLQDVPLSVSVVGGEELRSRAVATVSDLQYAVPGLSLFEYGPGKEFIQMRGMSNISTGATVGIYLDETPLSLDLSGTAFTVRLLDLERVEVLRGPQATLYGEGSMGGTIRYIPAAPKFDTVSGSAEVEYNSTKGGSAGYKAIGVINLPLSEKVALRLVGGYEKIGGYIDNITTGDNNVNDTDQFTIRGILLAKPSDRLTLSVMGLYQKFKQDHQDFGVNNKTVVPINSFNNDRYSLIQGKADYDLDFANLAGSMSYLDRDGTSLSDLSPFYVPLLSAPAPFGFGLPPGFITTVSLPNRATFKIFNSELRLSSQGDSALGWQFGGAYRNYKFYTQSTATTAPNTIPLAILDVTQKADIDYLSIFGEVNYAITPQLKATAGVRYFHEKKTSNTVSTNFGATSTDVGSGTFKSVNPRFNLSYAFTPNSMVYVNVAKGFRGGGFNNTSAGGGVFVIPPTYDPDYVWTYEIGTKHQLFGNKLILDASVYHSDWSKVQSYAFIPGSPLTVINNSGDVSGWGVDASITARPTKALTLTATYGWNNLEFDNTTADKNKGDPVDGAVRKSWSASADFRPPLTDSITGIFRVDYQHAGKAQITLRNFGGQIIPRPSRDLVNLRVGASFGDVEVTAFATNLFNEDAPNIVGPYGVFTEDLEQRPRVIGINARTQF